MLYNELTTVVPFYLNDVNQNRFKENAKKNCEPQKLISPKDEFLPFMIHVHCGKKPTKWLIKDVNGNTAIDASLSLPKIEGKLFSDGKVYAYFKGGRLEAWRNPNRNKANYISATLDDSLSINPKIPVVLVGQYYHEITFGDIVYSSELITFLNKTEYRMQNEFMKIEFRSKVNINSIRYIPDFAQILWLDTFSHSSRVEYEEEGEQDGENNFIPTFQKMGIIYENEIITSDFLKNAIHSLKLHDDIKVHYKDERYGEIHSVFAESESISDGALHTVKLDFLCTLLSKSGCGEEVVNDDYFNAILVDDIEITISANVSSFVTLHYSYTGDIAEAIITAQPGNSALNFIEENYVEINPQPYYIGTDNFKMKLVTPDGKESNEFNVKINIVSNWELEDEQFEMKRDESLEIIISAPGRQIIELVEVEVPAVGVTQFVQPNKIVYDAISTPSFEQIKFRAKDENNQLSNIATITLSIV